MQRLKGHRFKRALAAGIQWFSQHRRNVDRINVFPVADGDTGKNMDHAFQAALKEVEAVKRNSASEVAWAAARGALMGSRGCSGMILSGFFAGFAEGVGDRHTLGPEDLATALQIGCLRARERIDHPVEGTILSVGEEAARHARREARKSQNVFAVIRSAWQGACRALAKTRQQLKVLQEHHVVDAGGQGLVYFLEGLVRYSQRLPLVAAPAAGVGSVSALAPAPVPACRFCTELQLLAPGRQREEILKQFAEMGEHLMVAEAGAGHFKIHLHTRDAGKTLRLARKLGRVTWEKIDDMAQQHRDTFGLDTD